MLQRTDGVSDQLASERLLLMAFPPIPVLTTRLSWKRSPATVRILPLELRRFVPNI